MQNTKALAYNQTLPLALGPDGHFFFAEEFIGWLYKDDGKQADAFLVVKKGTRTNLVSVPWLFRLFINPADPELVYAAVLHDALVGEFGQKAKIFSMYTQRAIGHCSWDGANAIMRNYLRHRNVWVLKRQIIYWAIRAWGRIR